MTTTDLTQHVLSTNASDRATAYDFVNKVVRFGNRSHVFWTEFPALTFARTFDHDSGQWSDPVEIGEGCDNHNCVSVTASSDKRLHIAYGPHGVWAQYPGNDFPAGAFKVGIAEQPDSFEGLELRQRAVGHFGTYPNLLLTTDDVALLIYRGSELPHGLIFQKRNMAGNQAWSDPKRLFTQDVDPGYTFYTPSIAEGPDGAIYVAGSFYALPRAHSLGVGLIRSADQGETWTAIDGTPAPTPMEYHAGIAVPHNDPQTDPRALGPIVTPDNTVYCGAMSALPGDQRIPVSRWDRDAGKWHTTDAGAGLPANYLPTHGSITNDIHGRIHLAIAAADVSLRKGDEHLWSHVSNEVYHISSEDQGKTWQCRQISPSDPDYANWLPSISHHSPNHPVDQPTILYTHGNRAPLEQGCINDAVCEARCVFL